MTGRESGRRVVDLNADMGEGDPAADAALLAVVSSCNVACGSHAGDDDSMRRTVALALAHGVAIGAHPSYPDREGFGRRAADLGPDELAEELRGQIDRLHGIVAAAGGRLTHVKPHGALYNRAAVDRGVAAVVAGAVRDLDPRLVLVGLSGGELVAAGARLGLATAAEAFADRGYEPDGTLTPRGHSGALVVDPAAAAARAVRLATAGLVTASDGRDLALRADTICIHADTPGAAAIARAVRAALEGAGVAVAALPSGRR